MEKILFNVLILLLIAGIVFYREFWKYRGREAPEAENLNEEVSSYQIEIKQNSEKTIQDLGFKPNRNLPYSDDISGLSFQSAQNIAKRFIILSYLKDFSTKNRKEIYSILEKHDLINYLSQKESRTLKARIISDGLINDYKWVGESMEVLGWTLGLWPDLPLYGFCNEKKIKDAVPSEENISQFIQDAHLIDREEIYQYSDLIYRLHWTSKRNEIGMLKGLSRDVYMEHHKAINWVIGIESNWDEVPIDT